MAKKGTVIRFSICVALVLCLGGTTLAQVGIGKWRDHFSYRTTYRVIPAKERIYAQGALGLFYFDTEDYTINKLTKVEGLSDVGISATAYDNETGYLAIGYTNSNIDLVLNDRVYNLSDIKRSDISGDKNIYSIRFRKGKAYLCCGFGVAVVDLDRKEIADIYRLGTDGTSLKVNDIAFFDGKIVAALDSGLVMADESQRFLNIFTYWSHDSLSALKDRRITSIECLGEKLFAVVTDSTNTAVYTTTDLVTFDRWLAGEIHSVRVGDNKIAVATADSAFVYNPDLSLFAKYGYTDWASIEVNDAIVYKSTIWMAHKWAGLTFIEFRRPNILRCALPQSPFYSDCQRFLPISDGMYIAHGSISGGYYLPAQMSLYRNNEWTTLNRNAALDTCLDIVDIVVDPKDKNHLYACSWENGILEIRNNTVTDVFTEVNTGNAINRLELDDYNPTRTGAAAVDKDNNFWFTNSMQNRALVVRKKDGTWANFETNTGSEEINKLMIDSVYNYKWFIGTANRIYVHDGVNRFAYVNPNKGSKLTTSKVNCIAQDHDNEIWIGTEKGIKVIYSTSNAFANGGNGGESPISCNNILYSEGDKIEYLLAYESVTSIVVDGANRKWIGTSTGGLYLLSSNGLEQLEHFTSANSPLLSDKILSLAIMPWTGELFIVTDKGMCSYRATATYAFDEPMDDIHAFPNPVRPDFDGVIAIKGFTRNGIVHITDAAGNVVYATTSNGGQAIWNGCTQSGKRVASGVYYVFASSDDGSMRSATKILIIR